MIYETINLLHRCDHRWGIYNPVWKVRGCDEKSGVGIDNTGPWAYHFQETLLKDTCILDILKSLP